MTPPYTCREIITTDNLNKMLRAKLVQPETLELFFG